MKKTDTSHFIVCRAAAGSGKTYTLVRQYLELAFDAPLEGLSTRFSRILAITFTNKAANEMKVRILSELDDMAARGTACSMGNELAERLEMDDATLRRYATAVQQAILHHYSDFAVCTIDSFMHRLVRTFAHDLDLPINFDLQIDNKELVENAVDSLMALVGAEGQEELTKVLCEFAQHQMDENKTYMIENALTKLADELFKEQTPEYLAELRSITPAQFRAIHGQMLQQNRSYEQQMRDYGQQGVAVMKAHNLVPEDFHQGNKGAGAYFQKMANGNMPESTNYVRAYLEDDKLGSSKCSAAAREALAAAKPELAALHNNIEQARANGEKLYHTRQLLMRNLYELAVLNTMNELVAAYSKENDLVHISEFNKRISEVVESEPMPFIYERIGTHYYNYLIDEFQDTSRMQWQNLVPLLENGVANGHTSLVVGDGKQAIYRFRQGDVEQFLALPHVDSPQHGQLLESPGVAVMDRLKTNHRSCEAVVNFNNEFFAWAAGTGFSSHAELQEIYMRPASSKQPDTPDLKQEWKKKGGYVQVGFCDVKQESIETLWEQMVGDIRRQVGELGYRYRDITLLARGHKELNKISAYLTQHGIPVVSSESFLLSQSSAVMLLHSLFQYLVDGSDRVAAMRTAIYMRNLGLLQGGAWDTSLFRATNSEGQLQTHLLERLLATEGIALDCDRLRALGLYDACEEAIRMLRMQDAEPAFTATLLNIVARYSNSHRQDWKEFLEWFDDHLDRFSTSTSDDLDAVRLMTIHKSKGLESPIIMYPVLISKPIPAKLWVHIDQQTGLPLPAGYIQPSAKVSTFFDDVRDEENQKQTMDDLNVLYVALTRPREKLLIYCQSASDKNDACYSALLRDFLRDKPEALSDDGRWRFGEDTPRCAGDKASTGEECVRLQQISYPSWTDRISIAEQLSALLGQFDEEAVRRGNQMHALLSLVHNSDGCAEAVQRYRDTHPAETEEMPQLEDRLRQMMQQPEVARFFDPQLECKNECSLVWKGKVMRPDRIVLAEGETWVVDFKTGVPAAQHHDQVEEYCAAIRAMGYPNVKGYLLYIGPFVCQVIEG